MAAPLQDDQTCRRAAITYEPKSIKPPVPALAAYRRPADETRPLWVHVLQNGDTVAKEKFNMIPGVRHDCLPDESKYMITDFLDFRKVWKKNYHEEAEAAAIWANRKLYIAKSETEPLQNYAIFYNVDKAAGEENMHARKNGLEDAVYGDAFLLRVDEDVGNSANTLLWGTVGTDDAKALQDQGASCFDKLKKKPEYLAWQIIGRIYHPQS